MKDRKRTKWVIVAVSALLFLIFAGGCSISKSDGILVSSCSSSVSQSNSQSSSQTTTAESDKNKIESSKKYYNDVSVTVYITPTGKRYHRIPNCGNGDYYKASLSDAKSRGLTPCQKCYG